MELFFGLKNYIQQRAQLGDKVKDDKDTFGLLERIQQWMSKMGPYKDNDSRQMYVFGKAGSGKSLFLTYLYKLIQD